MSELGYLHPFRELDEAERAAHLAEYAAHLQRVDGDVAFAGRTLTRREEHMRELEAWAPSDAAPKVRDARVIARRREWLLAATKANEGESYGVEIEIDRYVKRGGFPGFETPELMLRVLMQESYHCRILAELCRTVGVPAVRETPAWPTRAFLVVIGAVPAVLRWAIVLAGECIGATLFRRLHDALPECGFAPREQERLQGMIREIWRDEVLHVAFLRAALGPIGLRISRALLPLTTFGVFQQVPDLRALGCTPAALLRDLRTGIPIPHELEWLRPDVGADTLPTLEPALS